jgi:hypothetical protein
MSKLFKLTSQEEILLRMSLGLKSDKELPLEKKSNNKKILSKLLEIEEQIIARYEKKHVKNQE